jgi:hypothetical protein
MDDIGPFILSAKTYMIWISKLDPLNLQTCLQNLRALQKPTRPRAARKLLIYFAVTKSTVQL